jgi:hypothetical protein
MLDAEIAQRMHRTRLGWRRNAKHAVLAHDSIEDKSVSQRGDRLCRRRNEGKSQ